MVVKSYEMSKKMRDYFDICINIVEKSLSQGERLFYFFNAFPAFIMNIYCLQG